MFVLQLFTSSDFTGGYAGYRSAGLQGGGTPAAGAVPALLSGSAVIVCITPLPICRFTVLYNLSIYQLRRTKTKMRVQLIFAIPRNALRQPLPSSPADTTLGSQFLSFLSLWLG